MNGLCTAAPWATLSQYHRPTYRDPNFAIIRSEGKWEPLMEKKKKKHLQSSNQGARTRIRKLLLPQLPLDIQETDM